MKQVSQQYYSGERALYMAQNLQIKHSVFGDGESPLKESKSIELQESLFKWKYPLWYANDITMSNCTLFETARSGIWYTHHINIEHSQIDAPKTFRRSSHIRLDHVTMPYAQETLWNCDHIELDHVCAKGDYFGMNSTNITIHDFELSGNYAFDGARNIEVHNATLISKDAFWNCENVVVYDSKIYGEYLGWNSKNITFINCTIESLQGLCYIDHLVMKNCRLINTTLAFEYSYVDAQINGSIDSVYNPNSGIIEAEEIKTLIMDDTKINPTQTKILSEVTNNAITI